MSQALGAFGEKLRKQREQRGIALEAISNSTKISTRMLRAIEEENFDQLPGGVFNKGFVRAFARQIGLNEDEAITGYLDALRESQIQSQQILPNLRGGRFAAPEPPAHEPVPKAAANPLKHEPAPKKAADLHKAKYAMAEPAGTEFGERNSDSSEAREQNASTPIPDPPKENHGNDERRNYERRSQDRRLEHRIANAGRTPNIQSTPRFSEAAPLLEGRRASDLLSESPREHQEHRTEPATPLFTTGTFGESEASNSIPWARIAAILIVIFAVFAFWNLHHHSQSSVQSRSSAPSALPKPAIMQSPMSPAQSAEVPQTTAVADKAASSVGGVSRSALGTSVTGSSAAGSSASSTTSIANAPSLKSVTHLPAARVPPTFTLRIRAQETTWISVIADGKPVARETLIAPAETSIRATDEIVVRTGNAAGISFLLNAKEIPAEGKEGEARTYTFGASGIKVTAAQPSPLSNN